MFQINCFHPKCGHSRRSLYVTCEEHKQWESMIRNLIGPDRLKTGIDQEARDQVLRSWRSEFDTDPPTPRQSLTTNEEWWLAGELLEHLTRSVPTGDVYLWWRSGVFHYDWMFIIKRKKYCLSFYVDGPALQQSLDSIAQRIVSDWRSQLDEWPSVGETKNANEMG